MTTDTTDQPTRTPEMQAWLDRAVPVQSRYIRDHKAGVHDDGGYYPGCPTCTFSGALETDE